MARADGRRMDATRRQVLAAMGGATAAGLAGCVVGDGDEGDAEFVGAIAANPSTFDPTIVTDSASNSTVGTIAYETLVDLTFDLTEYRASLATEWERVDDTTWQFALREGVEFHNGDEFTAEDVRFSVERMRGTTNTATVQWIDTVEVLGDYEVEIQAAQPHAPALSDMAAVPILPSGADGISESPSEDSHAFDQDSLGTGPFVLDTFEPEDRVELTPFENYWWEGGDFPGTAPWDRVVLRVITEQVSQEEAMHAGELDMIDNPAPFDLDQWEDADPQVTSVEAVGFDFVTYPVQQSPFSNADFRRGLTRLIPRSDVVEAVFGGNATVIGGPISPGLTTFWDEQHEQQLLDESVGEDPDAAADLLDQAFEAEDAEPPFDIQLITNVNRTRERWMEVIQQTLDETEYFNAELEVRSFDDLVPYLLDPEGAAQSTDVVGIGWTGGSDPDGHVNQLLHSDQHVPGGFNWNLYSNDEVDQLIEEGRQTIETDPRVDVYHELQEVLAQEVPQAYMWTGDRIQVVHPDAFDTVDDWQPYPNSSFRYAALYSPNLDVVVGPPQ